MAIAKILAGVFGSRNERKLKSYRKRLGAINALEPVISGFSDGELSAKRGELQERLQNGASLDSVLEEAFAVVREASKRTLGMRHFDVQLIGGMVLQDGMIAEMKTGEGKTLVATLPAFLNSLSGQTVHVVTANDYLAKRDATHLAKLYNFLGLEVGFITSEVPLAARKAEYAKNVVYATNNELGFDYLRDNMRTKLEEMCFINRELSFAIVDEIDSILIDEARTPLIISGYADLNVEFHAEASQIVGKLTPEGYEVDEKAKSVYLTESGYTQVEEQLRKMGVLAQGEMLFGDASYADQILKPEVYYRNSKIIHLINNALRAEKLFKKDVDYIIKDRKILIIDEFTGRISEGRRYSNGLHQALEAKHRVPIQPESQTVASVTYQNYFRMYKKLAGMTGTAQTEAEEFREIYKLDVVSIPTNRRVIRKDEGDVIYRSEEEKFKAIADFVTELHAKGQPVLIGTVSIQKSEKLSELFKNLKLPHNVLNAKFHEKEAQIIADAGKFGAITIATNMAGRGTDIVLGGSLEAMLAHAKPEEWERIREHHTQEARKVKEAGGLYIIGSERHESRRIDNQLRGRSGRQGDIGYSKFFLSLQDDLLRIFGGKILEKMLLKLGFKEGEAINHPWLDSVIERAQRKVEGHNFEIRKNLLKYDDMLNEQRHIVYAKRLRLVKNDEGAFGSEVEDVVREEITAVYEAAKGLAKQEKYGEKSLQDYFFASMEKFFNIYLEKSTDAEAMLATALEFASVKIGTKMMNEADLAKTKGIVLESLDTAWKEHLYGVDLIRSKISLRSYAQKDPLNEYKLELFKAFEEMLANYRKMVVLNLFKN